MPDSCTAQGSDGWLHSTRAAVTWVHTEKRGGRTSWSARACGQGSAPAHPPLSDRCSSTRHRPRGTSRTQPQYAPGHKRLEFRWQSSDRNAYVRCFVMLAHLPHAFTSSYQPSRPRSKYRLRAWREKYQAKNSGTATLQAGNEVCDALRTKRIKA